MAKGIYQLLIYLPKSAWIVIGKKGRFKFPKGYYVYTGSALNGLGKRIERHLRREKKHFWHIDYLLDFASIKKVFLFTNGKLAAKQEMSSYTPYLNPAKGEGLHKFPPPLMGGGKGEGGVVN
jgi:Uri superfamily endonuclease